MFDFVGTFFQKVGATIGGTLIAIGGFFGGSVPAQPEEPVSVDTVVEAQEVESVEKNTGAETSTPTPTKTQSQSVETKIQTNTTTKTTLQIESVKSMAEGVQATVTWTTTLPSESRLIFDNGEGRVFESESGLSTSHKIHTSGLEESEEYDYKITATTEDKSQYDDYFGTIFAPKKYTAVLGSKDEECQVIVIKDTAGRVAIGKEIRLQPSIKSAITYTKASVMLTTDSRGEIEYCEVANTYKVVGEELSVTLTAS